MQKKTDFVPAKWRSPVDPNYVSTKLTEPDPNDEDGWGLLDLDDNSSWTAEDACLHGKPLWRQQRVMFRYWAPSVDPNLDIRIAGRHGRTDASLI